MKEQEFIELALKKYKDLSELKEEKDFYEYEKRFDELWVGFGKETLEKMISSPGSDRRKKKV